MNVHTIKTRSMSYFTFELLDPILGSDLTARQVFELVVPAMVDAGMEDTCTSLI
jgi:hypothetical protein